MLRVFASHARAAWLPPPRLGGAAAAAAATTASRTGRRLFARDTLLRRPLQAPPASSFGTTKEDDRDNANSVGGGGGGGGGSATSATSSKSPAPPSRGGLFSAERVVARPGEVTNRWAVAVPAFAAHLCIGSPYAWSAMSGPLAREFGFVCSSAADWSLSEVTMPLSIVFALQGISAAAAGKWQMRVGARAAMSVAAACFGGGLIIGAAGIYTHTLPLVYLGYGVLGGCGVGIGYTPPLQALLEWFPDKKGLASGLCIAGFGSGALVFAPASTALMGLFAEQPDYVGPAGDVAVTLSEGRLYADVDGSLAEVVLANAADLAQLPYDGLLEGYYAVGTGNTGAAAALGILGMGYLSIMLTSAFTLRRPPPGYIVAADHDDGDNEAAETAKAAAAALPANIPVDGAMRSPQFLLLATSFFCLATGGVGLFSVAKPMMGEVFSSTLPTIVTASFASSYLLLLSAGNLGGRIGWAATSDKIGRRNTFHIFTAASIPLYLSIPFFVQEVVDSGSSTPLYGFMGATFFAVSMMGGTYALLPAYEADLFGAKYVGAIHGRMLLASTAAALAGPALVLALRGASEATALESLLAVADDEKFLQSFGTTIDQAQQLIQAKTITIAKLMDVVPVGTQDPTPFIYNTTCYAMAGLMAVAATSHVLVRKLDAAQVQKFGGEPPDGP